MNAFLVLGLLAILIPQQSPDLTLKEFETLHQSLVDRPRELWNTIPWHDNLISGRNEAIKKQKPIFIWSMDGHPLGCT